MGSTKSTDKAFSALGGLGFTYSYVGTGSTVYASSAAAPTNAGTYAVTATLVDPGYSNSSSRTEAFTILPKPITITADAKSKAYGETDPAWTFTSTGLLNSDSLTGSLTRASGENPGTHAITQGTLAAGANYQVVFNGAYLTIGVAPLASSAINLLGPAMLGYDGEAKSYTASSTGVSGFSLVYAGRNGTSYASSTEAPTQAGDYTVTALVVEPLRHGGLGGPEAEGDEPKEKSSPYEMLQCFNHGLGVGGGVDGKRPGVGADDGGACLAGSGAPGRKPSPESVACRSLPPLEKINCISLLGDFMTTISFASKANHFGASAMFAAELAGARPKALSSRRRLSKAADGSTTKNHCHFRTPCVSLHSRRSACRILSSSVGLAQKARWNTFTGSFSTFVGGSTFGASPDGCSTGGLRRSSSHCRPNHKSDKAAMTAMIGRILFMSWTEGIRPPV